MNSKELKEKYPYLHENPTCFLEAIVALQKAETIIKNMAEEINRLNEYGNKTTYE